MKDGFNKKLKIKARKGLAKTLLKIVEPESGNMSFDSIIKALEGEIGDELDSFYINLSKERAKEKVIFDKEVRETHKRLGVIS